MRRAALCMAFRAALLGAPSAVLAALPNQLAEPQASPTSGTTLTPFQLSVRYVAADGDPALGVSAQVGPLDIPLHLSSGTPLDGTWSVTTLLPLGSWPLQFHATVGQGPTPSLAGPSLLVEGEDVSPSLPGAVPGVDEPQPSSIGDANAEDPTPGTAESPPAKPDATSKPGAAPGNPDPAPRGGRRSRGGSETTDPAPRGTDGGEREGRRRTVGAASSPTVGVLPGTGEAPADGASGASNREELLLILAGIVGVATVALLGTGWMLASRERDDEAPVGAPTGGDAPTLPGDASRVARGGHGRHAAHDPVLAAMGLDGPDEAAGDPVRGRARGAAPRPKRAPPARR